MARTTNAPMSPAPTIPPPAIMTDEAPMKPVPLTAIVESPTNPRQTYDQAALEEMARNFKEMPLIQPIILRPWPKHRKAPRKGVEYECVIGSRRFRAHQMAKRETILARIVELTDAQVLELQLIENAQREDVHPLEEGYGYSQLLKFDGFSVEVIADRTGHRREHILKRLAFLNLVDPLKERFKAKEIGIGHAELLCGLLPDHQTQINDKYLFHQEWNHRTHKHETNLLTVAELRAIVQREYMLQLSAAPWKLKDAELIPEAGACTNCAKRTGAAPGLFEDLELGKSDRCLDRPCFERKGATFRELAVAAAKEAGTPIIQISSAYTVAPQLKSQGVIGTDSYAEVPKAKDCPNAETAMFADGSVGRQVTICRAKIPHHKRCADCQFFKDVSPNAKSGDLWADRAKALPEKIAASASRQVLRAILKEIPDGSAGLPHEVMQLVARGLLGEANFQALECLGLEYVDMNEVGGNTGAREIFRKHIRAAAGTPAGNDLTRMVVAMSLAHTVSDFATKENRTALVEVSYLYQADGAAIVTKERERMTEEFERKRSAAKQKERKKKAASKRAAKQKGQDNGQ